MFVEGIEAFESVFEIVMKGPAAGITIADRAILVIKLPADDVGIRAEATPHGLDDTAGVVVVVT